MANRARLRLRLTIKQYSWELYSLAFVAVLALAASVFEAWRLGAVHFPAGCFGPVPYVLPPPGPGGTGVSAACTAAAAEFARISGGPDIMVLRVLLAFSPLLIALVLGAATVAPEVEERTAPLSWTLAGSRTWWLGGRILALGFCLTVGMTAMALAGHILVGAMNPNTDLGRSFIDYALRGPFLVGSALAAFGVAAACSAVLRRTLPAMFVSIAAGILLAYGGGALVHDLVFRPMAVAAPLSDQYDPVAMADEVNGLPVGLVWYVNGKPVDGSPFENGDLYPVDATTGEPQPVDIGQRSVVIPGSRYWDVVAIQVAVLLATAAAASGVAVFAVNHRRPY